MAEFVRARAVPLRVHVGFAQPQRPVREQALVDGGIVNTDIVGGGAVDPDAGPGQQGLNLRCTGCFTGGSGRHLIHCRTLLHGIAATLLVQTGTVTV